MIDQTIRIMFIIPEERIMFTHEVGIIQMYNAKIERKT